jgi:hypothetical protein
MIVVAALKLLQFLPDTGLQTGICLHELTHPSSSDFLGVGFVGIILLWCSRVGGKTSGFWKCWDDRVYF